MRRTLVVGAVAAALAVVLWIPAPAASAAPLAVQAPICGTAPADYPPNPQGCVPSGTPTTITPTTHAAAAAANANRSASAGALARTGTDHLLDLVRLGIVILGVGAFVLYVRRRSTRELVAIAPRR
jgi:hypothetical protein